MRQDRRIDLFRLRNDTCFRCFATGVRLTVTCSAGDQSPVLHCELCHALSEAARHAQAMLRDAVAE